MLLYGPQFDETVEHMVGLAVRWQREFESYIEPEIAVPKEFSGRS